MNDRDNKVPKARDNMPHMINELLTERQQVLAMFCRVAGIGADTSADNRHDLLQQFCEILVDYSALWHFEIFKYIREHKDNFKHALDVADRHEGRIVQTSEIVVAFNDKYDSANSSLSLESLESDLSKLGEELAARIEAEDQILSAMAKT